MALGPYTTSGEKCLRREHKGQVTVLPDADFAALCVSLVTLRRRFEDTHAARVAAI
jgi:hypothetical protein